MALLVLADDGPLVVDVGGWAAPVGIDLVADRLSALMLTISSAVTLCVLLYSLAQGGEDDEESAPVSIYHPTYLVLTAGVANAFLSGDLFNLYVGFEILLAASYVLITLGGTGERIRAGTSPSASPPTASPLTGSSPVSARRSISAPRLRRMSSTRPTTTR